MSYSQTLKPKFLLKILLIYQMDLLPLRPYHVTYCQRNCSVKQFQFNLYVVGLRGWYFDSSIQNYYARDFVQRNENFSFQMNENRKENCLSVQNLYWSSISRILEEVMKFKCKYLGTIWTWNIIAMLLWIPLQRIICTLHRC